MQKRAHSEHRPGVFTLFAFTMMAAYAKQT